MPARYRLAAWFESSEAAFSGLAGSSGGPTSLVRVPRQRLAQQRQDLRAVVGGREVPQAEVGLARGDVVIGVVRPRDEVRRAHPLAQVAEAEAAARVEERARDRVAVGRVGEQARAIARSEPRVDARAGGRRGCRAGEQDDEGR
jgi:hypothetical protein